MQSRTRLNSISYSVCVCICLIGWMAPARAVTTSHWVHENEADFKAGTLHDVVVTNQGDVKLSRAVKTIREQDANVTTVNAIVQGPDGVIYAGTGPRGILLAVKDDKVTTAAKIDDAVNVLSLMVDSKGGIVLGTGGEKGRVLRIAKPGDKPTEIFSDQDVQYVWALQQTADGNIYAATGPNGQVFEIKPDGSHSELYKSSEDNLTSMISDGKDLLYLGTDPDGLVIRLNRKTKEPFIVYNAGETEITALALDGAGNIYAATGQVSEHQTAQQPEAEEKASGRPEQPGSPAPIPSNPAPAPPQPPPLPNPNPGEPAPIPKGHAMRSSPANAPKLMAIIPTDGGDEPGGGGGDEPGPNAPGGPGQNPAAPQPAQTHPNANANPAPSAPEAQPQGPEGNAIYKIDADGFVTEIFRQDAVIYSMIRQGDVLIVGTGEDGDIYQVNPATEETEVLAKVDAKQVMCLLPVRDGRIFMGLANTGGVAVMTGGYASAGTYLSPVLDATQVSRFGKIQLHGLLPRGARLQVATRSGNVKDADSPGWSAWSADVDAAEFLPIKSPSARFLQYRLTFSTSDPLQSAMVDRVDVAYQIPNMAPVIKSVRIGAGTDTGQAEGGNGPPDANAVAPGAPGAGHAADNAAKPPGGTGTQAITWDASDPNNDALTYTLYFRRGRQAPWVLLRDGLTQTSFEWDTRTVADGEYQVKVVASDELANPPGDGKTASRVSDYVVVDNTPPTIGDLDYKVAGGAATISLRVQVQISTVASVEYTLDSADEWQTVLPLDGIFDSPDEQVKFSVNGLTPGEHQVTIRATDSHGNQALHSIVIKVESATARGQ
ncbi:MAG: hypothetical protein ABSD28_19315 [Tepidisphaeraceae bacterium]